MSNVMTEVQLERFKRAEDLIADIQIELAKSNENENWRDLYWLRLKLEQFKRNGFLATRL